MTELAERSLSCGAQSTTIQAGSAGSTIRPAAAADATPPDDAMPLARIQHSVVPETLAASATRWRGNGRRRQAVPSWPLIVLAAPATVAVWSGWVRLGQMTGFGLVRPFPGLWDSVRVNTAITLPIGVEAYGAYALRAWLAAGPQTSERTRQFAKWSAIGSLLLGMSGQVAYHLLAEARMGRAPWGITMAVACLPVLILGMGAALSHLLHADTGRVPVEDGGLPAAGVRGWPGQTSDPGEQHSCLEQSGDLPIVDPHDDTAGQDAAATERLEIARVTALQLTSTGVRVSRRALRDAGMRGSNAELSALVRAITTDHFSGDPARLG